MYGSARNFSGLLALLMWAILALRSLEIESRNSPSTSNIHDLKLVHQTTPFPLMPRLGRHERTAWIFPCVPVGHCDRSKRLVRLVPRTWRHERCSLRTSYHRNCDDRDHFRCSGLTGRSSSSGRRGRPEVCCAGTSAVTSCMQARPSTGRRPGDVVGPSVRRPTSAALQAAGWPNCADFFVERGSQSTNFTIHESSFTIHEL
jgi:hypothetical protein